MGDSLVRATFLKEAEILKSLLFTCRLLLANDNMLYLQHVANMLQRQEVWKEVKTSESATTISYQESRGRTNKQTYPKACICSLTILINNSLCCST